MSLRVLVMLVMIAAACSACSSSSGDFVSTHSIQDTVKFAEAASFPLESGSRLDIPANTFDRDTIIVFSDQLKAEDRFAENYPMVVDPEAADYVDPRIANVVINIPVDRLLSNDITVRMAPREETTVLTPGTQYVVYRFDFENDRYNRWDLADTGDPAEREYGTVDPTGSYIEVTLPTAEFRGFIGSLAVFDGMTAATQGSAEDTTIDVYVTDRNDNPLSTDVGVYVLVGARKYPTNIPGGVRPTFEDPYNPGTIWTQTNMLTSDANGMLTIDIPANLLGQPIALEFGRQDPAYVAQDRIDIIGAGDPDNEKNDVDYVLVRYGLNEVNSRGVKTGTD